MRRRLRIIWKLRSRSPFLVTPSNSSLLPGKSLLNFDLEEVGRLVKPSSSVRPQKLTNTSSYQMPQTSWGSASAITVVVVVPFKFYFDVKKLQSFLASYGWYNNEDIFALHFRQCRKPLASACRTLVASDGVFAGSVIKSLGLKFIFWWFQTIFNLFNSYV